MSSKTVRRPQRSKRERDVVATAAYGADLDTLIRKVRREQPTTTREA